MNIGGALGIIGAAKLQAYPWGPLVVAITNTHLPEIEHVTLLSTGTEVSEKILSLDDSVTAQILAMDIGPLEGSLPIRDHNLFTFKSVTLTLGVVMAVITVGMTLNNAYHSYTSGTGVDADAFGKFVESFLNILKVILGVD